MLALRCSLALGVWAIPPLALGLWGISLRIASLSSVLDVSVRLGLSRRFFFRNHTICRRCW